MLLFSFTEFNKFTHEVEEVFQEVKQHVILSVRDFSIQIAFVLMGITAAILVIGTVYVWCFHHPKHSDEHDENESESKSEKVTDETKEKNEEDQDEKSSEKEAEKSEQNGQVRRRIPSSSSASNTSVNNNNNSPGKSKIPVRQRSVTKSP